LSGIDEALSSIHSTGEKKILTLLSLNGYLEEIREVLLEIMKRIKLFMISIP
jgi:hypothetical protein